MDSWAMQIMEELDTDAIPVETRPTIELSVYDIAIEVALGAMHARLLAKGFWPQFADELVTDVRGDVYQTQRDKEE